MAYLPSLPGDAVVLLDVFRAYPDTARPLLDYHQALLRGPSPLSVAERELIAAFMSGLNACGYCHGVHTATAQALRGRRGNPGRAASRCQHRRGAGADEAAAAVCGQAHPHPGEDRPGDADAVLAAGWEEQTLHDAVAVCGLFALMNRLVDELGITAGEDYFQASARRIADIEYAGLADLLGPRPGER